VRSEVWLRDGTRLVYERDVQQVHYDSYREFDPGWRFADAAGHEHYRDGNAFPTLRTHWLTGWCGRCGDTHGEGEIADYYTCLQCGERIEPGTRWHPGGTVMVPGPLSITLQGRIRVPAGEAQELLDSGGVLSITIRGGEAEAEICRHLTAEQAGRLILAERARHGPG